MDHGAERTDRIRLYGQVAIVTGAAGGLGSAYARLLAELGAAVVVNDLGAERDGTGAAPSAADRVAAEIMAAGGRAVANHDSVASAQGGEAIVRAAVDAFGRLDILVNNAGNLRDKSFAKMTPEMWESVVSVHLNGSFYVTRAAFPIMRGAQYGRIVFVTSAAGLFGNFGQANYGAAKMGLVGLMNCLKPEMDKYNIRVNCIAPLAVTRMNREVIPQELHEALVTEVVAPLVAFLCSPNCETSGGIYNAGMGYFSRTALVSGPAIQLAQKGQVPTIEDICQRWKEIDVVGDQVFEDATSALIAMAYANTDDNTD